MINDLLYPSGQALCLDTVKAWLYPCGELVYAIVYGHKTPLVRLFS